MAFPDSGAISPLEVDPASHFTDEEYLLTGSARTASIHTIPMIEEHGDSLLSKEGKIFNRLHKAARVQAEDCIEILKGRFQSLKALRLLISNRNDVSRVDKWIQTCCILHNFLIDSNEEIDKSWTSSTDDGSPDPSISSVDFQPLLEGRITVDESRPLRDARNGLEKREILKHVLRESDWI